MERTNHLVVLTLSKGCRVDRRRLLVEADGLCEYSSCRPILQTACLSLTTCSRCVSLGLVRTSKGTLPTRIRLGLPERLSELYRKHRIDGIHNDVWSIVSGNYFGSA